MERFSTLSDTLKRTWNLLFRAAESRSEPMRTPVLATFDGHALHQRVIVLRQVTTTERKLYFFTDRRSPKVNHLEKYPKTNALFWDPRRKVQIESSGIASLHQDNALCAAFWQKIGIRGRSSYATVMAPGESLNNAEKNLPADWSEELLLSQTDYLYANFTVIEMQVEELDVLHLHPEGHQRAQYDWTGTEWNMSWVVP